MRRCSSADAETDGTGERGKRGVPVGIGSGTPIARKIANVGIRHLVHVEPFGVVAAEVRHGRPQSAAKRRVRRTGKVDLCQVFEVPGRKVRIGPIAIDAEGKGPCGFGVGSREHRLQPRSTLRSGACNAAQHVEAPGVRKLAPAAVAIVAGAREPAPAGRPPAGTGQSSRVGSERTGAQFQLTPGLPAALCHEIHGPTEGVWSEQRGRSAQNLDAFHKLERQQVEVHLTRVRLVHRYAVEEDGESLRESHHRTRGEPARDQRHLRGVSKVVIQRHPGLALEQVAEGAWLPRLHPITSDHRDPRRNPRAD